ncbi:hypothetical protein M9458_004333, partial [Cirrhinus mrigala]
ERASRTLYRVGLLCRLRERVLPHPSLEERLSLAPPSSDLPNWWSIPQHDHELLLAAARHGVSRTELSIFSDPQYSFSQARLDYLQNQQAQAASQIHVLSQSQDPTGIKEESLDDEHSVRQTLQLCSFPILRRVKIMGRVREKQEEREAKGLRTPILIQTLARLPPPVILAAQTIAETVMQRENK